MPKPANTQNSRTNITETFVREKSDLQKLLASFQDAAKTEREKGTYFEELMVRYFENEPKFSNLYSKVYMFSDWAKVYGEQYGFTALDIGIDLVAQVNAGASGGEEFHAIQCKFYKPYHVIRKEDIDSFFTASGKKPFTARYIVTTTNNWSEPAENALMGQAIPVSKIDLYELEKSLIDWSKYSPTKKEIVLKKKKTLRPHQIKAVADVLEGFKSEDRGKLIMACGTGKTYTSLKIAEKVAGADGLVLFLVPSLALLSQSLTEWTQESDIPIQSFAVCSDSEIGKKRNKGDEKVETFSHELSYPATTESKVLARRVNSLHNPKKMTVVFSTYHSIQVLADAQKNFKLPEFDLIICDEAHRTTGAKFEGEDESHFIKVHDQKIIKGKKRLYMTATPRIFGDVAKAKAEEEGTIELCSMDDEKLYGKEFHTITFSQAVTQDLLVDYKVIVLAVDEAHVNRRLQKLLADEDNQLRVDDAAKIIGCFKALSKHGAEVGDDDAPMTKAVAFCQRIEFSKAQDVTSSKLIAKMFEEVVNTYLESEPELANLTCQAEHIDGSMNATEKEAKLAWLKEKTDPNTCRILSNVRCLSEGVDVPALDAVLFLSPRQSQVDVVQSVGRVMRKAPSKKRGYVILPIVIPAGKEPHEVLDNNKSYRIVWQVLQALRSHDDRFDAMVNKMELVGPNLARMEVIAVTDHVPTAKSHSTDKSTVNSAFGGQTIGALPKKPKEDTQQVLEFQIGELERAIYAKIVKKVGNRRHWEEWAGDIAKIANTHIDQIKAILENQNKTKEIKAFQEFVDELRDDLNDAITDQEVIEMLAQHLITKPVFDALFSKVSFANENPVSKAMDKILKILQSHNLSKESMSLDKFYASVKLRAEGIDNAEGKQKIILELYDKFFRGAFPKMTERLGIVYTPVEVVDFIIHSVNDLLQKEFNQTLGSKGVHILDPFTGTGTFITRLLQSGLISQDKLTYKYENEIHANEIVLLAYYIAAINIESTYHSLILTPQPPLHSGEGEQSQNIRTVEVDIATTLLKHARELRKNQTNAEELLWQFLRNRQFNNLKFRRQHPLKANFILDFYCAEAKLGIEIDGNHHKNPDQQKYDELRTEIIKQYKINIIRFTNDEVLNKTLQVLQQIAKATPLSKFERGSGGEGGATYSPFKGILLTDTFQMYEKDDEISKYLADNSDRRNRQKELDIKVIMCNPPYSSGQGSANDNNQNVKYEGLDSRIANTYAKYSTGTNKNALYDSYIRAIRWASDKIGDSGILGMVTNAGWIDGNAMDGLRKCLEEEFTSIYIFHLRGNQRTAGETSRKEGGKIFGSGSRAPIAISLFVKKKSV
ncbi:MAG: hypothetical protein LDLANPLL_01891 [Turneriella sp.]|nr:hypothetical protein [Turneriella sp.]